MLTVYPLEFTASVVSSGVTELVQIHMRQEMIR